MTINYEILDTDKYLKIIATGVCENLDQQKEYALAIHNATISSGHTRIFVDETQLVYKLSTFDSFDSGKFISSFNPKPKKIAVLCKPEDWKDARFWETVAVNRGVPVQVFKDQDNAEEWVLS